VALAHLRLAHHRVLLGRPRLAAEAVEDGQRHLQGHLARAEGARTGQAIHAVVRFDADPGESLRANGSPAAPRRHPAGELGAAVHAAPSTVTPRSARLPSACAPAARTRATLDQSNSVCVTVTRPS